MFASQIEPEWMRPGNIARKFGIPRSTLYDLIKKGLIRSASFKEKHQRHGQRLISVESVRSYIEEHATPVGNEELNHDNE